MFKRPESLQRGHSDQILLHPCFGCCLSGWNTDGRKKTARRAPKWKCSVASPSYGLASGDTLWARFRKNGKMKEGGSCEMEGVFPRDCCGVNTVVGSDPSASIILPGPFTQH